MSTTAGAATMDPNTVTTVVGVSGASSLLVAIAMKLYTMFYAARTDAATSKATREQIDQLQEDNKALREENNQLRENNLSLAHDKYTFKAGLDSALEKITWMTQQMQEMKVEMTSMRDTIKELRNEQRSQ